MSDTNCERIIKFTHIADLEVLECLQESFLSVKSSFYLIKWLGQLILHVVIPKLWIQLLYDNPRVSSTK